MKSVFCAILFMFVLDVGVIEAEPDRDKEPQGKVDGVTRGLSKQSLSAEDVNRAGAISLKALSFRKRAMEVGLASSLVEFSPKRSHAVASNYSPAVWKAFFTSSVTVMLSLKSDNPISAFYNPLCDGVLFIKWKGVEEDGILEIWGASSMSILDRRETLKEDTPRYLDRATRMKYRELKFPAHLPIFGTEIVSTLESVYPPLGEAKDVLPVSDAGFHYLERWTFLGVVDVINLHSEADNPEASVKLKAIRESFVETTKFQELLPKEIALKESHLKAVPVEVRRRMKPVFATEQIGRKTVFFIDPDTPRVFLAIELLSDRSGIVDALLGTVIE